MNVRDWLGEDNEIGIAIWENKYRHNNESFEEWLDRVSNGNPALRSLIVEKKFLFGGRALANRNTGKKGSMFNCFTKGHKVITKRGWVNIEDVIVGDYVLSEDNDWHKVNDIMCREYKGDLYKISSNCINEPIMCTPNHQFLTDKGWKRADRIMAFPLPVNRVDRLKIPTLTFEKKYDNVDLIDYIELKENQTIKSHDNDTISIATTVQSCNGNGVYEKTFEIDRQNQVKRFITMDSDMRYFIGRWIGDGSVTIKNKKSRTSVLQIVFNNKKEKDSANKIIKIGSKHFGFEPNVRTNEKQNTIIVRWNSEILCNWFYKEFGRYCDGKKLDDKYIGDMEIAKGILDSDGSINTHGSLKIVLKNKGLIEWLQKTLFLNSFPCGEVKKVERYEGHYRLDVSTGIGNGRLNKHLTKTYHDKREGIVSKNTYYLDYVPITNIEILENQNTYVYNISVEDVHSYTVNGVVVHNCYSSGYAPDDINGLMELNKNIALTYKAQGGQGISLSQVRPKGTPIGNEFSSDGIVPFMEIFNTTTDSISQGGARKGALMLSIDVKHKEAPTFITIKTNEDKITKANLSLEIDDEFMTAIQEYYINGKTITLHQKRDYNGHIVEYDIVPIKLYKLMIETVYDWAEPGCIFTDRFRNYNIMEKDDDYQIVTCNPCVSGDTEILTKKGYLRIDSVVGQEIEVWNGYEWSKAIPKITGHNQNMKLITFSNGEQLKCTDYHKFILKDSSRIEAKELNIGDSLIKCNFPIINSGNTIDEKLAYTQGFFCGDGSVNKDDTKHIIYLYGKKIELKDYLMASTVRDDGNRLALSVQPYKQYFNKSFVPNTEYDIKARLDWLAGYIDSDGTVQSHRNGGISISSVNKENLIKVKRLLNTLGCDGKISIMHKETEKLMPTNNDKNEEKYKLYKCKESYRLLISKSSLSKLIKLGLNTHRVHADCNVNRNAERFITITNIEDGGFCENVYCFTEPKNHSGIFNGVITAQCGEQPMPKDFSCNLGSLNLAEFVIDKYKECSTFDWEEFKNAVSIAVSALDTIIDENIDKHALKEQAENSKNYRNIGLGVMGYGTMLFELGIEYGSDDAKRFTEELFSTMFKEAVEASSVLAEDLGSFPKYKECVWDSEIIKNHFSDEEILVLKENGLRNCSLLSIAPTGLTK